VLPFLRAFFHSLFFHSLFFHSSILDMTLNSHLQQSNPLMVRLV
jgi:hypothetical protein